ncbi:MAG: type III-B CRISPR module RAMP protein Cmr4 [Armatimonadota bacterium]
MMPGALMFIKALTSLHPGAGTALEAIDLPIQREKHTDWPMIQGGSVKGVLRDVARRKVADVRGISLQEADAHEEVTRSFGPPVGQGDASEFGGSLVVSDARIAAFPVRSLKGVYALITCPMAVKRLVDDCGLAGVGTPGAAPTVNEGECLCATSDTLFFGEDSAPHKAVLEDFAVTRTGDGEAARTLADWLGVDPGRLVIVHDDLFTFCVRYRTEVITRNALDPATKTVAGGALWSEEFLPPETLLYSVLLAERAYGGGEPEKIMANARCWFDAESAQFGGDASTGKGICALSLKSGAGERQ